MRPPAVEMDGITKRFPGVIANDEVDLTVERGTVHALLGENGAGKTTLMNVLYGLYEQNEGTVSINGELRDFDSPRDAIDAGIGMIHQHFMLVDPMTVAENIVLGNEPRKWLGLTVDQEQSRREVRELSDRYGFDVDPDAHIEDVSVGVQQRVEILKALYRGADILILDEPTAVLTPQEVEELYGILEDLKSQDKTIIFITHKLGEAMHSADTITVLRDGNNVGTVDADETTQRELAQMMVGREVILEVEKEASNPGDVALSASNVRVVVDRGVERVSGVDLSVRDGEVLGIAGVDGNGQSELVEAITGLTTPDDGQVTLGGENVTDLTRRARIERGMAYIPEDRQDRGLVMDFDLVGNGLLGNQHHRRFAPGGRVDWPYVKDHVDEIINDFDVRPPDPLAEAHSLSGGNQQKFVVGREFKRDPSVVIASHPTRGLDVGSVEFVHEQLLALRDEGKAILLVSSKLDEVRQLSDRLAVMYEGDIVAVVDPDDVTEQQLGLLMAGEQPEGVPLAADRPGPATPTGTESTPADEMHRNEQEVDQ